jgi:CRP/FNR family transcriptional regulator
MMSTNLQQRPLCNNCIFNTACFGDGFYKPLNNSTLAHKVYHRGEALFNMGDKFDALYILRSGSAKSYMTSKRGDEQITGFYYPGDLIGVDGFAAEHHAHSLKFLETSSICHLSVSELNKVMAESAGMSQRLLKYMSQSIVAEQQFLLSISNLNSEQRLIKFLLDMSARLASRGLSGTDFDLSMTRIDIANYLGMAIETISRLLSKLQQEACIEVNRRQVKILDPEAMLDSLNAHDDEILPFIRAISKRSGYREVLSA